MQLELCCADCSGRAGQIGSRRDSSRVAHLRLTYFRQSEIDEQTRRFRTRRNGGDGDRMD